MSNSTMLLRFDQFVRLGAEQGITIKNPLAARFVRTVGPLGTHARIRNARMIHSLPQMDWHDKEVLDVGCGHGYILFHLAQRFSKVRFTGIENDPELVRRNNLAAKVLKLNNLQFLTSSLSELDSHAMFDLILSTDVLEHVPDDLGMLQSMSRRLRPDGRLLIHVPLCHRVQRRLLPAFRHHTVIDHVRDEYLPNEIRDKVETAGFEIELLDYGFGFWGELSFELNNLFWNHRVARNLLALITLPFTLLAGYTDACSKLAFGNSIVILARLSR